MRRDVRGSFAVRATSEEGDAEIVAEEGGARAAAFFVRTKHGEHRVAFRSGENVVGLEVQSDLFHQGRIGVELRPYGKIPGE